MGRHSKSMYRKYQPSAIPPCEPAAPRKMEVIITGLVPRLTDEPVVTGLEIVAVDRAVIAKSSGNYVPGQVLSLASRTERAALAAWPDWAWPGTHKTEVFIR